MVNRIKEYLEQPEEPTPPADFWIVQTRVDSFYVTAEVAAAVLATIGRRWPPKWVAFTDLAGGAVRVRARLIDCVTECTAAQRQAAREFQRARRKEYRADCPPWEEDWW